MASIVVTQKPAEYFTFTAQHSPLEEQANSTSPSYWNSSPFTDDFLSDDSILTSPTTPGSPLDFRPAFPTLNSTHKRKQRENDEVDEPLDLGSFEDWLRWDDNEDPLTDMNNLRTQDPEETVVFIEDPVSSSPLFQTRQLNASSLTGVQPRETLYSPPIPAWSYPAVRSPQQQQQSGLPFFTSSLSPQEEARLRDIAMPSSSSSKLPTAISRTSSMGYPASPSPPAQQQTTNNSHSPSRRSTAQTSLNTRQRKRKSTSSSNNQQIDEDSDDFEDPTPTKSNASNNTSGRGKKSSHNMIEKRYRNNLNDKIAELRDSVPSLRVMSKHEQMDEDDEMGGNGGEEDLQGLTPAHKLNKATILSKATEYIAHLEKRNAYLTRENAGLKARVDAFEILVMARPQQQQQPGGYQQQRQDYQQGYEAGQRAFRQQGSGGNVVQSPGWVA